MKEQGARGIRRDREERSESAFRRSFPLHLMDLIVYLIPRLLHIELRARIACGASPRL